MDMEQAFMEFLGEKKPKSSFYIYSQVRRNAKIQRLHNKLYNTEVNINSITSIIRETEKIGEKEHIQQIHKKFLWKN